MSGTVPFTVQPDRDQLAHLLAQPATLCASPSLALYGDA